MLKIVIDKWSNGFSINVRIIVWNEIM